MMVSTKHRDLGAHPGPASPSSSTEKRADIVVRPATAQTAANRRSGARSPASKKYCRKPDISTPHAAAWPRRWGKEHDQRQRRHHREVERNRCRRRAFGKTVQHVEHPAIQRHQGDQQQIGKGDPRQFDGQAPLLGLVAESGGQEADRLRHEQQGHHQQHRLRDEQQRENAVGEQPRRGLAALAVDVGIGRDKGENAPSAKIAPKLFGRRLPHIRRRRRASAEDGREHDVARQEFSRDSSVPTADGEKYGRASQPLLAHPAALQNGEIMDSQFGHDLIRKPDATHGSSPRACFSGSCPKAATRTT